MLQCHLLRLLQLSVVLYISVAVLYTTNLLLFAPLRTWLSELLNGRPRLSLPTSYLQMVSGSYPGRGTVPEVMYWNSNNFTVGRGPKDSRLVSMTENLFLTKAFSQSMRPSNIIPYFYRATGVFHQEDITITTLITSNRLKVFAELVQRYQGPISVTVHVKNITSHVHDLLGNLHKLYTSTPHMSTNVDVHLVIDSFDRQFNTWRNIARLFARTDYVMMLDVDFAVCTDFRTAIRSSSIAMGRLRKRTAAFVIPAFEFVTHSDGVDGKSFPRDKEALLSLVKRGRIDMFHRNWPAGHNSSEYDKFYAARPGEMYKVTTYQSAYEPYIVYKKEGPPWCDERFVGYGGNKAACHFEMHLSGMSYYVLADHFLVHQSHPYEEVTRKNERKFNRKVYADFKEETCLRYLKGFHEHGVLNTGLGYNVIEECKKIKGISRITALLVDG